MVVMYQVENACGTIALIHAIANVSLLRMKWFHNLIFFPQVIRHLHAWKSTTEIHRPL